MVAAAEVSDKLRILEEEEGEEEEEGGMSCGGVPCDALRRKMVGALVISVITIFGSLIAICLLGILASGRLFPDVNGSSCCY